MWSQQNRKAGREGTVGKEPRRDNEKRLAYRKMIYMNVAGSVVE